MLIQILKKVMSITNILFEACLFTALTLLFILEYKMLNSYFNNIYCTFREQLILYVIGMVFMVISGIELTTASMDFYQFGCVCYLGISPYYISIMKGCI